MREVVACPATSRRFAIFFDEEPWRLSRAQPIPQLGIVGKPMDGVTLDGKLPIPAILRVSECEHGAVKIDVLSIQRQSFVHPHARHRDQAEQGLPQSGPKAIW